MPGEARHGDPSVELSPDDLFDGRYRIKGRLGAGERKVTYLAHDGKLDRQVAIAVVQPKAALIDPEGTEREAKVLGRIGTHDNIVSLYDYEIDETTGLQYMVFEYLAGGTLAEHVEKADQLPLEDILRLARQICRGLAHLHDRGVLHRDVSPGNVWLDERGTAHLGDFDSAIVLGDQGQAPPLTTNAFAAPEERQGRALDVRADLYSLGGLLRAIALGTVATEPDASVRSERPDLPSSLGDLVESLMAESPDDRLPNIGSVLAALERIRRTADVASLIAQGEGERIEFKASLLHAYGEPDPTMSHRQIKKALEHGVTKTIAAFLNSSGGDLLIGIRDDGQVLGIEPDFAYLKTSPNADGWLRNLKEAIGTALGLDVWNAVHVSLVPCGGLTVAVVSCPRRPKETWCTQEGRAAFYARTGNGTMEYDGRPLVDYIRERWGSV